MVRAGVLIAALAAQLLPTAARAEEQPEPAHPEPTHREEKIEEKGEDVAGFIFHHISDAPEYELEIPLNKGQPNPVIHFPVIRVPLREGACPASPHEHASLAEGCLDLSISKYVAMMWVAAALLIAVFLLGSHRDKTRLVPRGRSANLLELLVLFVRDEIAVKTIGPEEGKRYTPFLLSIFFFILFMNLLGLIPFFGTATGNLAVTCGLAVCAFVMTQYAAIRSAGFLTFLKHLTGGVHWGLWPIMIPVEILGLFTKPFALTVRLFANMAAGHIVIFFLLGLIFMLKSSAVAVLSVPMAMGIYFLELFVAFLQAYVFTMLTSLFIGMSVAMAHHSEHDAADHGHGHTEGSHSHDHGKAHFVGG